MWISLSKVLPACFNYALEEKQDLWFATKDTISKTYDHDSKHIKRFLIKNIKINLMILVLNISTPLLMMWLLGLFAPKEWHDLGVAKIMMVM